MVGTQNWSRMSKKNKEAIRHKLRGRILDYIISQLNDTNDVFFIHELPGSEINLLRDSIAVMRHDFSLAVPESLGYINTVAVYAPKVCDFGVNNYVCCQGTYGKRKFSKDSYINRIICLRNKQDNSLLFGVHVKSEDIHNFYQLLSNVHSDLPVATHVLYIGDFNACDPDMPAKSLLCDFMSLGLVDIWAELGGRHTTYTRTSSKKTYRIDYALTDGRSFSDLRKKYSMYVDRRFPDLSDHYPIILAKELPADKKLIKAGKD